MRIISESITNDHFSDACGARGGDRSPHVCIIGAPGAAVSFALVLEDRDAFPVTGGFSWIHWTLCDFTQQELPENASSEDPELIQGINSYTSMQGGSRPAGECVGYCGMSPPNEAHLYTIHVYALDTMTGLQTGFGMHELYRAMRGHVLAEASLDAWYDKV